MKYEGVLKSYYKYPEQFEEIYNNYINSDFSYVYDYQIGEFPIFVMQLPEIHQAIDEIRKLDKELMRFYFKNEIPAEAYGEYITYCLIDEVFLTNEIEGVRSTKQEIQDVLESVVNKDKKKGFQRFKGLVYKYMRLVDGSSNSDLLKSPRDIRALYDEIVLNEIDPKDHPDGEIFRKGPVSVTAPGNGRSIHEGIFPESEIISQLSAALKILNSESPHPLINIAVFHYLFGYIHPFYDGNGRTVRFISSMYLSKEIQSLVGVGLSYTIKEKYSTYSKIFDDANDVRNRGDLTLFVVEFLGFVRETIKRIFKDLLEKSKKLKFYNEKLKRNECFKKDNKACEVADFILQATLFSINRGIQSKELAKALKVSVATANKWRESLTPLLLSKKQIGKKIYYSIDLDYLDNIES